MATAVRWTTTKWRAQLLIYLSAYWAYSATRWIAAGEVPKATAHAHWIVNLEKDVHVSVEGSVQRALDSGLPIWVLNHLYLVAQFAVVPGALIFLYSYSPAIYRTLRNTLLATWLIAVPIYALFPVAPPRLAGIGILDTISGQSEASLNSHVATSFYNPFAAVPSLHAGFAFAVGTALAVALRPRWAKGLALLWGPLVSLAVVATGNHYLFDIVAGMLVTVIGFWVSNTVARRWPARRSGREHVRSGGVVRGNPCGAAALVVFPQAPPQGDREVAPPGGDRRAEMVA
jgi:membrane-associated phospholipid phosphatase